MPSTHRISREAANEEIINFIKIREELRQMVGQPATPAGNFINSNTLSFVFHRDHLNSLFDSVDANAYRIYFAADATGNPSLVIVPCTISSDESTVVNKMATDDP